MGMYNWVNFEIECPKCGNKVDGFQSKPWNGEFEWVNPWDVEEFHTQCDNCFTWIEYERKSNNWSGEEWMKDYDCRVELNG